MPVILISFSAGVFSSRIGTRWVVNASRVMFTTAPLLYRFVETNYGLMSRRFHHGFATAAAAEIADHCPGHQAKMLLTDIAIRIVGRCIARFLGGFLICMTSYPSGLAANAIGGLLAWPVDALLLADDRTGSRLATAGPGSPRSPRSTVYHRTILAARVAEAAKQMVFGAVEAVPTV